MPDDHAILEIECVECKTIHRLIVKKTDLEKYKTGTVSIQNAFLNLNANERELILSRICGSCFDKLFK